MQDAAESGTSGVEIIGRTNTSESAEPNLMMIINTCDEEDNSQVQHEIVVVGSAELEIIRDIFRYSLLHFVVIDLFRAFAHHQDASTKHSNYTDLHRANSVIHSTVYNAQSAVSKGQDIQDELKRFSPFERCLMISVLEECINKLVILGANRKQYASNSNFLSAGIRLANKHVNMVYDLFRHIVIPQSKEKLREIKFQRERELIVKVLSLIRAELIEMGEINAIYAYLTVENHCRLEYISIADRHRKNVCRLDEIKLLSEKIRDDTAHTANNQEIEIEEKQRELDLFKKLAITQMMYNYRWQSARYDQNKALIERHSRKLQEEIGNVDNKSIMEDRVHKEISKYLTISTKQIEEDIKYWNDLYKKDIGRMEMNIMNIEGNIEDASINLDLTERATKAEEDHLKILKEEKEERDALLAIERLREECAIKIQAWWRGNMVRWEFGRYAEIMKKKFKKVKKPKK